MSQQFAHIKRSFECLSVRHLGSMCANQLRHSTGYIFSWILPEIQGACLFAEHLTLRHLAEEQEFRHIYGDPRNIVNLVLL